MDFLGLVTLVDIGGFSFGPCLCLVECFPKACPDLQSSNLYIYIVFKELWRLICWILYVLLNFLRISDASPIFHTHTVFCRSFSADEEMTLPTLRLLQAMAQLAINRILLGELWRPPNNLTQKGSVVSEAPWGTFISAKATFLGEAPLQVALPTEANCWPCGRRQKASQMQFSWVWVGSKCQQTAWYDAHQAYSSINALSSSTNFGMFTTNLDVQRHGEGVFFGGHRHFNLRMTAQLSQLQAALEGQIY